MSLTFFLDPDGTHELGHLALIYASTGIVYQVECDEKVAMLRGAEGYLVTIGPRDPVKIMADFVLDTYLSHGRVDALQWSHESIDYLSHLVAMTRVWSRGDDGEDRPSAVLLDRDCLGQCVDGWIPVETVLGKGAVLAWARNT